MRCSAGQWPYRRPCNVGDPLGNPRHGNITARHVQDNQSMQSQALNQSWRIHSTRAKSHTLEGVESVCDYRYCQMMLRAYFNQKRC
jgi:hypothetical protein